MSLCYKIDLNSRLKDYKKALDLCNQGISIDSQDNSYVYFIRGNIYLDLKDYQKALEDYNQAIKIYPHYFGAYSNIGLVKYEQGEISESQQNFEKALEIDPKFPEAQLALAVILYHQGDTKKAL